MNRGVCINFAHRTFQWSSEARGKAAVHCVIIGFALEDEKEKLIFSYDSLRSEPHAQRANNVNPYLVDAENITLENRRVSISMAPSIVFGSMANDGGYLLLSSKQKEELITKEPRASKWIRQIMGSDEFINANERWCLWLVGCSPGELRSMPAVMEKIESVRHERLNSSRKTTRELANIPMLFAEIRQPEIGNYLLIPRVSSEQRLFIPMGFISSKIISTDRNLLIPGANLFHFGVLSSTMHMAWTRAVCGRLESRYSYSAGIVYNNFPWPAPNPTQKQSIEKAAQGVLDARAKFPKATLAELYDPITMPSELTKAHQVLDRSVDAAYGEGKFTNEAQRVAFLFKLYQEIMEKPADKSLAPHKNEPVKGVRRKLRKPISNRGKVKPTQKSFGARH